MKKGQHKCAYGEVMEREVRFDVTRKQHDYMKAKAKVERKAMGDIGRELIEKAYAEERRNGVDIVEIAKDYGLI